MAMVLSFSFGTDAYAQSTQDKLNQKENERNENQCKLYSKNREIT